MVNDGSSPIAPEYSRSSRAPMPWNVPAQCSAADDRVGPRTAAAMRSTRRPISGRGAARERQQQDAVRIGAVPDQVGDAVGQRVGLAGACAGDHQQRAAQAADAVLDGAALLRIEGVESGGHRRESPDGRLFDRPRFLFCSQWQRAR
jgi:hypothetical protein